MKSNAASAGDPNTEEQGRKKILYVITRPIIGGAQTHLLTLIEAFKDKYEIHVAVGSEGFLTEQLTTLGVSFHISQSLVRSMNPFKDWKAIRELVAIMKKINPSIVHAHSTKAGLIARIAAKRVNIRSVYTVHGWAFDPGVKFIQRMVVWPIEFLSARYADHTICVTDHDRIYGIKKVRLLSDDISVIPNGVPDGPNFPHAKPGVAVSKPLIVMPARFHDQKDQETLIKAAGQLKDLDFQIRFLGDGHHMKKCEQIGQELKISDKLDFFGLTKDVPQHLAQAHIFALISFYEGLPISIMEAMRAGLPVIASDVSGVSEEVDAGETGFLTKVADVDAIAAALRKLIENPQLRASMGDAGRRKYEAEFKIERLFSNVGKLYDDMVSDL